MNFLRERCEKSPEFARVAPYGAFAILTALQGQLGPSSLYWLYLVKTLVGAWMLWEVRGYVREMRWALSWEAILVGVVIFVAWVGLDGHYPRLAKLEESGTNPFAFFGSGSALAWSYIAVHITGMTVVVPPLEEILFRSFLYRYFVKLDFRAMPLGQFHALSFVVTSLIFGLLHPDRWVAGILCGLAYQWLVIGKNRLGDAITAHAITNLLLGIWIVWRGAWTFW